MAGSSDDNNSLALFCDFENIALGVRDAKYQKFDISHILEKLLVKGSIVVKKAYCDWQRYKDFKVPMHEASFELIDIPHVRQSGKNSADIRMVVDALDLCYTKAHVNTFVIISGDSDFSPLVSKLRENAKTVIGVGVKNSTSDLLINNCDEFIYYDDLVRELERKPTSRKRTKKRSARSAKGKDDTSSKTDLSESTDNSADTVSVKGGDGAVNGAGQKSVNSSSSQTGGKSTSKSTRRKRVKSTDAGAADPIGAETDAIPADSEGGLIAGLPGTGNGETATETTALQDPSGESGDEAENDEANAASERAEELIQDGLDLLLSTASALSAERDGNDKLWGSMVKQTLKRRRPGFNESYYGFDSFGKMLEEAQARGYLTLELDDRSGGYIIRKITG